MHGKTYAGMMVVGLAVAAGAAFAAGGGDPGVKAQIAAERKGSAGVFETALAATEAKVWESPKGGTLPYRLHVPAKPVQGRRYPLVVHMHGAGSWGTNNVDQIRTGGAPNDPFAQLLSLGWFQSLGMP